MMKKQLLLSTCLTASLLYGLGGVKPAYAKAVSTAANVRMIEDDGDTDNSGNTDGNDANGETETTKNSVADGVATIYVNKSDDLKTFVENTTSFTTDFQNATRVNIIGAGVTLSEDDLGSVKEFKSMKTLDLSKVSVSNKSAYSKIVAPTANNQIVKINLIVPAAKNTVDENGKVTAYGNQILNLRQVYDPNLTETSTTPNWNNYFWNNIKAVFSFYNNESRAEDCYVLWLDDTPNIADIASGKCNNLSVITNTDANNNNVSAENFWSEINKMTSTDGQPAKLVLSNFGNNVKNSFKDISKLTNPMFKWVVLPDALGDGAGTTDLTKVKGGEGSDVEVVQILEGSTVETATLKAYIFEAGVLSKMMKNHYYQTSFSNAWCEKYSGAISVAENQEGEDAANDFVYFNDVKNNRLDLSDILHEGTDKNGNTFTVNLKSAISTFKNSYVEYLVLPSGVRTAEDPTFADLFSKSNPSLKGVGLYTAVTTTTGEGEDATSTTEKSIVISSHARGAAYEVEGIFGASKFGKNSEGVANVDRIQVSGIVSAVDLNKDNNNYVDNNGHLSLTYTKHETNGSGAAVNQTNATAISNSYMSNCAATKLDLTNVRLYDESESLSDEVKAAAQNDLNIGLLGWSDITDIKLPVDASVYRMPNGCFYNIKGLSSLCIPTNYKEIGEHALHNMGGFNNIYTSDVVDGTRYWYINGKQIDHEPTATEIAEKNTLTLPLDLTRIEFQAFSSLSAFTDVYVQNNKSNNVPYCEKDVFDSGTLFGWGGYSGGHPITRNSYNNNGNHFAVLHFPSGLKRAQTKLYTDITRNYTQVDETGATDDNGDILVWPTQAQWLAAYSQACTGYNWEDWKMNETVVYGQTDDANTTTSYTNGQTWSTSRQEVFSTGTDAANNRNLAGITENDLNKADTFAPLDNKKWPIIQGDTYIGWHQFVLTAAYNMASDNNIWHSYITDDNWWTISLPFDMTATEIENTFGEGTKLCTLTGVTRDAEKNTITLKFGEDLVAKAKSDTENTNAAVLVNRAPYMIKPGKLEKLKNSTDGENEYTGPIFSLSENQNETVSKLDLNSYKDKTIADLLQDNSNQCAVVVNATNAEGKYIDENNTEIVENAEKPAYYKYVFVAQYTKYYIPTYAYFLGWDNTANNGQGGVNYFYQTEKATVQNWNAYTCTIGHYEPSEAKWVMPGTNTDVEPGRWEFSCVKDATNSSNYDTQSLREDKMPGTSQTSGAKPTVIMYFGADNTTSIDGISANGSVKTIPAGTVYNLSGQVVSTNGIAGLSKGIYIANGKKFVVK